MQEFVTTQDDDLAPREFLNEVHRLGAKSAPGIRSLRLFNLWPFAVAVLALTISGWWVAAIKADVAAERTKLPEDQGQLAKAAEAHAALVERENAQVRAGITRIMRSVRAIGENAKAMKMSQDLNNGTDIDVVKTTGLMAIETIRRIVAGADFDTLTGRELDDALHDALSDFIDAVDSLPPAQTEGTN